MQTPRDVVWQDWCNERRCNERRCDERREVRSCSCVRVFVVESHNFRGTSFPVRCLDWNTGQLKESPRSAKSDEPVLPDEWCLMTFAIPVLLAAIAEMSTSAFLVAGVGVGAGAEQDPVAPVLVGTVTSGYLFIDGEYIPQPYVIETLHDDVLVNGRPVPRDMVDLPTDEDQSDRGARGGRERIAGRGMPFSRQGSRKSIWAANRNRKDMIPKPRDISDATSQAAELCEILKLNCLLVHIDGQPTMKHFEGKFRDTFLSNLAEPAHSPIAVVDEPLTAFLPKGAAVSAWEAWVAEFVANEEFTERVDREFAAVQKLVSEARSRQAANGRIELAAYPLTLVGMLLAIGAFGHLLRSVPQQDESYARFSSERLQRATGFAVLMIIAFSCLDLTWTIMSAQAGTMRELNPLGGQLIHDPVLLTVFKATATAIGCSLLYSLRANRRAADAAWWMCLIMTFVTFRWVLFNSMFV